MPGYVPGMSDLQSLLATLPIDQLAAQVGASPEEVQKAAGVALPALLGGIQANAESGGLGSLLDALTQHEDRDASSVDASEGARIASHIFGDHEEQVINQLGSTGVSSGLLAKLIPLLAPFVMGYLAKQMGSKGAAPSAGGSGDVLGQILGQVLGGSTGGAGGTGGGIAGQILGQVLGGKGGSAGDLLGGVLGGLLGGGRK